MRTIALIATAFSILYSSTVLAWGREGHSAIAEIAEHNLTPTAHAAVKELLAQDLTVYGAPSGRTRLADVSSWADELRSTEVGPKTSHWHFRSNSICSGQLSPCKGGHCVDEMLKAHIQMLASKNASLQEKNEALKWVVHLVGDIHQPLHVGSNDDAGGNSIQVAIAGVKTKGRQSLHKAWDTALVRETLTAGIVDADLPAHYQAGTVDQWMRESIALSKSIAYGELPSFSCSKDYRNEIVVLDKKYQGDAEAAIKNQIVKAGLRLAATLNSLYD